MIRFRYPIGQFEVHCTHACNLKCAGCSHYSDIHQHKHVPLDEVTSWLRAWTHKIEPRSIKLCGGEPAIYPDLIKFIIETRRIWPSTNLSLFTNGLVLLKRHPKIGRVLKSADVRLTVSQHHGSPEFMEHFTPALDEIKQMVRHYGLKFRKLTSYQSWRRQYQMIDGKMVPFTDGDPQGSWDCCPARRCFVLFKGKMWKCPSLAYLHLRDKRLVLDKELWEPYLRHPFLRPTATFMEMKHFFTAEAESCCGMCPSHKSIFLMPNPLR